MSPALEKNVRPLSAEEVRRMQQKAEGLVADLRGQFHSYAVAALAGIGALVAAPRYDDPEWRARLHGLAHDLKGLGGTFGYDLMTVVAGAMCKAVADPALAAEDGLQRRIAALNAALEAIIRLDLRGHGGASGRALLATLRIPAPEA